MSAKANVNINYQFKCQQIFQILEIQLLKQRFACGLFPTVRHLEKLP